ncbi:MAG: hypothetical protein PVI75_04300 [Gammaproteobacteria bacterium]|jgi:hypothetical protein
MKEKIRACLVKYKWLPFVLITIGIVSFLLGIFLSAAIIKDIWLCFSVLAVLIGGLCCFAAIK